MTPLAHELNSIFKCKQYTLHSPNGPAKIKLHNNIERRDILQPQKYKTEKLASCCIYPLSTEVYKHIST